MSQNKLENGSAGAVPIRIALQPEASPANDTDCAQFATWVARAKELKTQSVR